MTPRHLLTKMVELHSGRKGYICNLYVWDACANFDIHLVDGLYSGYILQER